MKKFGRINYNFKALWHFSTNIIPVSMPFPELITRHRDIFKDLYEPENFEERAINLDEEYKIFFGFI